MNTKTYLSKISNSIFLISSSLILSFIWLNYYLHNFKLSLISSILISLVISIVYFSIRQYKAQKSKTKLSNSKLKENLINTLMYSSFKDNIELTCELFNISQGQKIDNYHIISDKMDIFICYDKEKLDSHDILSFIKSRYYDNIKIFCIHCTESINTLKNISIEIFPIDDFLQKASAKNHTILQASNIINKPKLGLKNYLCIILSKDRSKGYFSFGLLLLVSSLFTIYRTYYIIMGTILLLLSIYSRFNSKFNIL